VPHARKPQFALPTVVSQPPWASALACHNARGGKDETAAQQPARRRRRKRRKG